MLERLLLASMVTCLLYVSLPFGQSSMTPTRKNQSASYAQRDYLSMLKFPNLGTSLTAFSEAV